MKIAVALAALVLALSAAPLRADDGIAASGATASEPAAGQAPALSATDSANATAPAAGAAAAPAPWTLPQPCVLQRLGIIASGWLEQGATINTLSPSDRWNGPLATNDRSNEYEMNQAWLTLAKPVNTNGCGWDFGGRVDLLYGTDWRYGDSLGLETNIDAQNRLYGFDLPQFYAEVGYNDLTVKIGHYAAVMGYEVVPAPGNFFYSHSYELAYAEAVLVTGVQAEYKLSNNWSVNGGFNRGWGVFSDDSGDLNFLGGAKWHNDANTTAMSFEIDAGPQYPDDQLNRYDYALYVKQQLSKNLLYVIQHNLGGQPGSNGYANWYGVAQYLIYTINPKWSAGTRIEWFRDDDGDRVAGVGNVNLGWDGAPGFVGTFTEWTTGINYRPCPNLVIRPEIRCDWYSGSVNNQGQLPFGDGHRSQQLTLATDMVLTF
ncbi:MAG: outer membrane beta-barrel protein [Thermoguttaceae bacterium]